MIDLLISCLTNCLHFFKSFFAGNGDLVVRTGDVHIAAGLFQNQSLKVEWGNVTLTENYPEHIEVTGGLVKLRCQSVSCKGFTIKSLVLSGGQVEIYSELSIEKLELNGGMLVAFSSLSSKNTISKNGHLKSNIKYEITMDELHIPAGGYLFADRSSIILSRHTVLHHFSRFEAQSTIIKQTGQGIFYMHSNASIQTRSSTFQNFGLVELKPASNDMVNGVENVFDINFENYGTLDVNAPRAIFRNTFRNTGHFKSGIDSHVSFEDGTLSSLGDTDFRVLGKMSVETSASLEAVNGFIDIGALHCSGTCTLFYGKITNLTSTGVVTFSDKITETFFEVEQIFVETGGTVEINNEIRLSSIFLKGGTVSLSTFISIETLSIESGLIAGIGQLLTKHMTLQKKAAVEISKIAIRCEKEFVLTGHIRQAQSKLTFTNGYIELLYGAHAILQRHINVDGVGEIRNHGLMIFEKSTRFHTTADIEIYNTGTIEVKSSTELSTSLHNSGIFISDKENVVIFNSLTITASSTFQCDGAITVHGNSNIYSGNVTIYDIIVSGASLAYHLSHLDYIAIHSINLDHGALSFIGICSTLVEIDMVTVREGTLDIDVATHIGVLTQFGGELKISGNVTVQELTLKGGVIQGTPSAGYLTANHVDIDGQISIILQSIELTSLQSLKWKFRIFVCF